MRSRLKPWTFCALVIAATALAPAGDAQGPTCQVSDPSDDASKAGTLRNAVTEAKAGATITFCQPITVMLNRSLNVEAKGVTIEGPGGISQPSSQSKPLFVRAEGDRVVLRGLSFTRVAVKMNGRRSKLLGSTITVSDKESSEGAVDVGGSDVQVGDPDARNKITSNVGFGILVHDVDGKTDGTKITGNDVEVGGKGLDIVEAGSRDLKISNNNLSRGMDIAPDGVATVTDNKIKPAAVAAGRRIPQPKPKRTYGITIRGLPWKTPKVTLKANEITGGGIEIGRSNVEVSGHNIIRDAGKDGIAAGCGAKEIPASGQVVIKDNELVGNRTGIRADCDDQAKVVIEDNTVTGGLGDGIVVGRKSVAALSGGQVTGNAGTGIFVEPDAHAAISEVVMGDNGKLGIDLAPAGPSNNKAQKKTNLGMDFPVPASYDDTRKVLIGSTCKGCVVEAFTRAGDEGSAFKGAVNASKKTGRFKFPAADCGDAAALTFTATRDHKEGDVTSEFSEGVDLKCPITEIVVRALLFSNCADGFKKNYAGDYRTVRNIPPQTSATVEVWWFDDVCRSQTWTLETDKGEDLQFKPIFPPYTTWDLDSSRCSAPDPCEGDFKLELKLTNSEPDDR